MIEDQLEAIGLPRDHAPRLLLGDYQVRHLSRVGAGREQFRHVSTVPAGVCLVCSRLVVRWSLLPRPIREELRDAHTEHCCRVHGCKYGNVSCTVESGEKPASFRQECCED